MASTQPAGHSNQLIYAIDLSGNFIYVNDGYCELTGLSRESLIGSSQQALLHEDMPRAILQEMATNTQKGFSWRGMIRINSRSVDICWLDSFITPIYSGSEIVGYQTVSSLADNALCRRAKKFYSALNQGKQSARFEVTRIHKFLFLTLVSLIAQVFIYIYAGLEGSIVAAAIAVTPILIFWHDIIPMAQKAQQMQDTFDSLSRYVYHGKGTASVFDFNFGMLKTKIRAILERTQDATTSLSSVVGEVRQFMGEAQGTLDQQRDQVGNLSASMAQMNQACQQIAENTDATTEYIRGTEQHCGDARQHIEQTANQIKALSSDVEASASSADQLSEEAKKVGSLMQSIQEIADQTNLLALNAAIEAARAGEHGRGFAVVADEVRTLSFRTQETAQQVNTNLTGMLNTINHWAGRMKQNQQDAECCVETAELSDQAMTEVYSQIQQIGELAQGISHAANEQTAASERINQSLQGISEASEETWQKTDKVSAQMEVLHQSAEEITNLTATFMPVRR
ncbi:MAG: methyl-accepting chemotaxis protein [Motiliproteus sp.]|nr:methyl-accepting chemotaxis protein [Motiliproteus sp.]MCW9050959.1 methyl-accepting chemotaxis protein [Motiliproteus sp.]